MRQIAVDYDDNDDDNDNDVDVWLQDCCLILFHPYRSLLQYVQDISGDESLLQLAW